jgi:hypothetical protein
LSREIEKRKAEGASIASIINARGMLDNLVNYLILTYRMEVDPSNVDEFLALFEELRSRVDKRDDFVAGIFFALAELCRDYKREIASYC